MSWKFRMLSFKQLSAILWLLCLLCCLIASSIADNPPTKKPNLPKITKPRPSIITSTSTTTTTTEPSSTTVLSTSTTDSDGSSSSTTTNGVPDICLNGIKATIYNSAEDSTNVIYEEDFVDVIERDVLVSVLTTDTISALFVMNRINQANIIEADFEIGMRAIYVQSESLAENLLIQEVEYLQQCVRHAIGIFIDFDLYKSMEDTIKVLEYNIWPIPKTRAFLFPRVAHLLYQMPWGEKIASVEIVTENLEIYNDFMEAVRHEHMCLMHFKSEYNIYILFGNKMANNFKENGTVFAVPTERTDRDFITDLPNKSFVLMENEIDLRVIDQNVTELTLDEALIGKTVLPSRVLALANPLLDLMRWLKGSLIKSCKREHDTIIFNTCLDFLKFIEDWQAPDQRRQLELAEVLDLLRMRKLASLMNFQMFQKKKVDSNSAENQMELLEIAAQNFVSNVTTYYHYNRENHTSVELKTKFGQVFNCQYSTGDNTRYPFLFDGESVMFWRLKLDTWVATGMTAAILGVIITLAILVFIVVRISLGDVFEGNPVTSILLLLSLILLFTSFIPFSMEYVGEHPNSHITFEDATTLNTLCAVRVFLMTLVYCFAFSLLLCRAVMLASIGSEGGFLSHVNGYIQAVICIFSIFVQLGMSIQLLVVMQVASESVSCENMYYGHWLWALMAYDLILLLCVVGLVPFIYRSQRNYREGILIVIGAVLVFIIWIIWITMALFGDELRDAAIPLGLQATGWAILVGVLIPRTFLIVRGIERSDIAQALPSLTSLAFAQNNQYSSEQSVYECVNPAMRNCSQEEIHQSPSEIPTLPLRGGGPRRQQFFANLRQANANINPQRPPPRPQPGSPHSSQSSLPGTPDNSKITRF
ncbi:protein bride of sevenless-like [Teleopsis dalmanni]|uniref:protein bride of sevenless-like n=1 Tax=Teleopsis dalmanni TaxID=139649 RepID=UPI0018CE52AA|nr:protein bride of sevenless-like [Teleopsis dalmanni]